MNDASPQRADSSRSGSGAIADARVRQRRARRGARGHVRPAARGGRGLAAGRLLQQPVRGDLPPDVDAPRGALPLRQRPAAGARGGCARHRARAPGRPVRDGRFGARRAPGARRRPGRSKCSARTTSTCRPPCASCSRACASCARRWPPRAATSAWCSREREPATSRRWTRTSATCCGRSARRSRWPRSRARSPPTTSRAASCSSGSTSHARSTRASCSGCSASRSRSRARSCSTRRAQRRCAAEVQTALGDLRTALQRPLGHSSRPTAVTFAEELERVRGLHPDLEIVLEHGRRRRTCPRSLEALAQSILVEAVRNARKHADATLRRRIAPRRRGYVRA